MKQLKQHDLDAQTFKNIQTSFPAAAVESLSII